LKTKSILLWVAFPITVGYCNLQNWINPQFSERSTTGTKNNICYQLLTKNLGKERRLPWQKRRDWFGPRLLVAGSSCSGAPSAASLCPCGCDAAAMPAPHGMRRLAGQLPASAPCCCSSSAPPPHPDSFSTWV
jgi:hypothetical protein